MFPNQYDHWIGRPGDPGSEYAIPLARRTMFEGYLRTGLAKPAAESVDHFLLPEIDKSGHLKEGVVHFLARNRNDMSDTATARLIDAADPTSMPTYELIANGLKSETIDRLRNLTEEGIVLKEMGALAKSFTAHDHDKRGTQNKTTGVAEVIRTVLGATIGTDTLLYCSMVEEARNGLGRLITFNNLESIGTPVVLEENEFRRETTLVPVLIDPNQFVPNILAEATKARTSEARQRLMGSFLFFADQLSNEILGEKVAFARAQMRASLTPQAEGEGA